MLYIFLMLDLVYQNGSSWLGLYHSSASSKRCSICRATLPSKCVSFVALTSYHRTLPRRLGWKVKISAQTPQPTWLHVKKSWRKGCMEQWFLTIFKPSPNVLCADSGWFSPRSPFYSVATFSADKLIPNLWLRSTLHFNIKAYCCMDINLKINVNWKGWLFDR